MSGIGALIDGAFKGYTFGEGVKDVKRRRKIQDEEMDWAREDRDWAREDRKVAVAERDRLIKKRDDEEAAISDAYEDARQAHETRAATNPADLPGVTAAPTAPTAPGGEAPPASPAPLGRSMRPQPQSPDGRTAPTMPQPNTQPDAAPRRMPAPSAPSAPSTMADMPASFANDPVIQEKLKQSTLPPERVWAHLPPDVKQKWIDAEAKAAPGALPGPTVPAAATEVMSTRGAPPMTTAPSMRGAPPQDRPPAVSQPLGRTMHRTPPAKPNEAQIEQEAAARNEDPNVEAARAHTVKSMNTPQGVKDDRKGSASDSFIETYQRVAVPQIVEHYLKTGDIDKAKSFEEWIETTEAKALQRDFGRLTYSLAIGDLDSSLDHLSEMYESINDGYTINREKSRFETYDNGQPSKLVVVVEDAEGNQFDWVVEDQGDLAAQVLGIVNPMAAHEYLLGRNEAAVAERAKNAKTMNEPITREELTTEVKRLKDDLIDQEQNATLLGQSFTMPSEREIEQMALDNLRGRQAALQGGRSYETRQPPPDWTPTQ